MKRIAKLGFIALAATLVVAAPVSATKAFAADDAKAAKPVKAAKVEQPKYVASKEGGKYHLPTCASASRIKVENKVTFKTKAAAEKAGYKPCEICKP